MVHILILNDNFRIYLRYINLVWTHSKLTLTVCVCKFTQVKICKHKQIFVVWMERNEKDVKEWHPSDGRFGQCVWKRPFFFFTLLYITCIKKNVLLTFLILYFACFLNPVDDYSQNYIFCNYILLRNEFLKSYRFLFCTI